MTTPLEAERRSSGSVTDFERAWQHELKTVPRFAYPRWDTDNQWDLFEEVKIRRLAALLDPARLCQGRTLEYGCGPAGVSVWLANQGYPVIASDISGTALQLARLNQAQNGQPGAASFQLLAANAMQLPFPDASFDCVVSNGLLEHFDEASLKLLLAEVMRVLKPGGLFFADIVHGRFSVRTVGKLVNYLASAGYHLLRGRFDRLPGLWAAYFDDLYENKLNQADWQNLLSGLDLQAVEVAVSRPFPPLAVSGRLEKFYVKLMKDLYPLWVRFDRRSNRFTRAWGWLYLAWGVKPAQSGS